MKASEQKEKFNYKFVERAKLFAATFHSKIGNISSENNPLARFQNNHSIF